ncbi:MAG: hypothetical protein B1H11_12270 [Desulfobacteraceae bacterium 4484_190.1]|nr:MAG: hypothetical protein B1H11_12270 [Desulfobacteraceae bacterium 4484_190.1]
MMNKWRGTLFTLLLVGALGLIFVTTSSVQAAFAPDLVAYWKLDEAAGPSYVDEIIPAYDGAGNGNPDPVAGQVNGAQDFNGTDDGIDVSDADDFDWGPYENFTIEFWMKKSTAVGSGGASDNEVMIGRQEGVVQWWIGVHNTDGLARFFITLGGAGVQLNSAARVDDGEWHHIVVMRAGEEGPPLTGEWRLYVDNGAPVVSPGGGADLTLTTDITMGYLQAAPSDYYYEGILDQVAIYTRALTADEIDKNYNLGLEGLELDDDLPDPPDNGDGDDDKKSGGGSSGCFISTSHQ